MDQQIHRAVAEGELLVVEAGGEVGYVPLQPDSAIRAPIRRG